MSVQKFVQKPSLPLIEVMMMQANDGGIHVRHRGAPFLKKYAPPVILGKAIEDVSHEDIERVLDRFTDESPTERNGSRLVLDINCLMKWAMIHGLRIKPWEPVKRPVSVLTFPVLLSRQDTDKLIEAVDTIHVNDLKLRIAVRALALLGLGVKETTQFSIAQVDFTRKEYHQSDYRGRYRIIPIPSSMLDLLEIEKQNIEIAESGKASSNTWILYTDLKANVQSLGDHCGMENLLPSTLQRTAIQGE